MSFQDTNRRTVRSGGVVFRTFEQGPFWRIASGAVCLETTNGLGRHLVQLALPGDLLGVETLFDQPMRFQARALVATALDRINLPAPAERTWLMREALETQQERSLHMTAMRTGAVANRLGHFLQLMGHSGVPGEPYPCARSEQIRRSLPPLRDLAEVVDAKAETVCRVLAQLLPKPAPAVGLRLPPLPTLMPHALA